MLSMYGSKGSIVDQGIFKKYLDYIVKDKTHKAIKCAGIVYQNGHTAAQTSHFKMTHADLRELKRTFESTDVETISFQKVTYCVKSCNTNQIVCFNGSNYLIISRTEVTYIIVICTSRQKSSNVATWINGVAKKLRDKNS